MNITGVIFNEKKSKKIYLASPYTTPDEMLRVIRVNAACSEAGRLMNEGHIVFSPIAHSHAIAQVCDFDGGWEFWKTQDFPFIEWCDELHVLNIEGWHDSVGVLAEIEHASKLGKPVVFMVKPE